MNKERFKIGDAVRVIAEVEAEYEVNDQRFIHRRGYDGWRYGQIVGMTRIYLGKYQSGYQRGGSDSLYSDPQPPYLSVKGCEEVWLVRFGMLNRAVKVLDEDIEMDAAVTHLVGHTPDFTDRLRSGAFEIGLIQVQAKFVPVFQCKRYLWTEKQRKEQREIMKDAPRDEKGRWIP